MAVFVVAGVTVARWNNEAKDRGVPRADRVQHVNPDTGDCTHCGQQHRTARGGPSCHGHVTTDRDRYVPGQPRPLLDQPRPCRKPQPAGLTHCDKHGAGHAAAKDAAERRTQMAAADKLMRTLGEPVEGADASEVITERIAARAGHVHWLLSRVQQLEPDALTWGLTKRKTSVTGDSSGDGDRSFAGTDEGDTFEAKPHIWYSLYVEAARDLERLCIDAIRVGLDERRVRIAEQQADLLVSVLDGVIRDLGHDPNDPATADVVGRHLRLVS